jgi:hypothetical protein
LGFVESLCMIIFTCTAYVQFSREKKAQNATLLYLSLCCIVDSLLYNKALKVTVEKAAIPSKGLSAFLRPPRVMLSDIEFPSIVSLNHRLNGMAAQADDKFSNG